MTELEEKQADCPYCHNDPKQADLLKKYTDDNMYIVYLKSNTLNLEAAGLRTSEKVSYCPMCGRPLNEEDSNGKPGDKKPTSGD